MVIILLLGIQHFCWHDDHRINLQRLLKVLERWTIDKRLEQHVLVNESCADAFFRYLEEIYGCGHLASHVAHACMMAFDDYMVSSLINNLFLYLFLYIQKRLLKARLRQLRACDRSTACTEYACCVVAIPVHAH